MTVGRLPMVVAVVALVVAIAVVELGLRAPAPPGVAVPLPGQSASSALDAVRAIPIAHINDASAAAVADGVIFGRTEHVTTEDEAAFLDSGLWHLLAASGQNIALVATCCILLARGLGAGRTMGGVLALVAIPGYVAIVGSGASIVRAGIMGELALVAWLLGALADLRQTLLVSAAAICWIWPGAHRSIGMQLSYACVAALALWASPVTAWLHARGVPRWLAAAVAATAVCGVSTAPILTLRTGASPLTGTIANLVAVPLAGAILVAGLAATTLTLLGDAAGWSWLGDAAMWPVGLLARTLLDIAHRAAALPGAKSTSVLVGVAAPFLVGLAVLVPARLPQRLSGRVRARAGPVLASAAVVCVLVGVLPVRALPGVARISGSVRPVAAGEVRIGVLDIGQGDATLIATSTGAILVDTGPPDGRVVDRVRALGVTRVDGIVLTHDSLDHRGGFPSAYASLHPSWVAKPRAAKGPWRRIQGDTPDLIELCAGDTLTLAPAVIHVLHPRCDGTVRPRTGDLHNDGAIVLLLAHGSVRAVLPADAEGPVLNELALPQLDLLRISHHGSEDPALPELLRHTQPAFAAISVGAGNEYGHPRPRTLAALDAAGVPTTRTDHDGTIVLDSDGATLRRVG